MTKRAALLIIDAQANMFAEGASVFDGERMLRTLRMLIDKARGSRVPVFFVQNNGGEADPDFPGAPGWEIHPDLSPLPGEPVIQKRTPDSFFETSLQTELRAHNVDTLVIAGMQTDFCVEATCKRGVELGYAVTLARDGHSTYDGGEESAAQIIARWNEEFASIGKVEDAGSIQFS